MSGTFVYRALFTSLIFCLARLTLSEDLCSHQDACRCTLQNNSAIDLSSIGNRNGTARFFYVPAENETNDDTWYSYNPCFPFSVKDPDIQVKVGETPCKDVAMCKVSPGTSSGDPPMQQALGIQTSARFFKEANGTLAINYTANGKKEFVTMYLQCQQEGVDPKLEIITIDNQHIFTLSSKCCCVDGCRNAKPEPEPKEDKKGLSTGSILLITFFVIIVVYFGVGILWKFCNGAQGQELLPNTTFWTELPSLISDGFIFTFSCCGKRTTYGQVE